VTTVDGNGQKRGSSTGVSSHGASAARAAVREDAAGDADRGTADGGEDSLTDADANADCVASDVVLYDHVGYGEEDVVLDLLILALTLGDIMTLPDPGPEGDAEIEDVPQLENNGDNDDDGDCIAEELTREDPENDALLEALQEVRLLADEDTEPEVHRETLLEAVLEGDRSELRDVEMDPDVVVVEDPDGEIGDGSDDGVPKYDSGLCEADPESE
jgi:hypothetical protein